MGELAVNSGKADVDKEVQVSVTNVEEVEKDKAESGKPGPNRILRYAEVWVFFADSMSRMLVESY